ncbi:PAS domain S-box [Bernardetia litoralis DSM 6794]|uniref:PAS domain S-box n=1 Tax=Bernardetia litoralis (strain ATCC 23117 / DSM 6794 / NBRC 15988 / NCIMB 1366 / Fx l1 / Sio-4) TaxID=880071 RepID=I4AQC4_BERLS|nr:GAF domain-containing protein [Bernardetia litoralis]AFM06159.1 PAS domain S-box [Bernardetia litoralis DSM 6794]
MQKRFSLNTLTGTLQFSYILVTIMLGLTLLLVVWRGNSLFQEHEDLYKTRSMKYHASELRNSLNHSFMLLQLYAQYDTIPHAEEIYYKTAIYIFDEALVNFNTVQTLSKGEKEAVLEIKPIINQLNTKYNHLKKFSEKGDPLRNYLRIDMTGLVIRLNTSIDKFIIDEKNTEIEVRETLNSKIIKNNYFAIPLFIIIILITYFLGQRALRKVLEGLKLMYNYTESLSQGKIPDSVTILPNEFGKTLVCIRQLSQGLEEVKDFAQEVGKRNFEKNIDSFPIDSQFGEALHQMKISLEEVAKTEQERNWQNQGVVEMGEVIRKHTEDMQVLCDELLSNLVKYIEAQQGAIFLPSHQEKTLILRSSYAYGRKKIVEKEVRSDEGILGEVFQDAERVFLTDIPNNYTQISAGLGNAKPNCVLVVPLAAQEKVLGVLEIASFKVLTEVEIRLVERTAEILAASISSVANAEKMKNLLEKSNYSAQQMSAQEEELRQNTEELMATREELERQLIEIQGKVDEKDHIFENSNQAFAFVDASGRFLGLNYSFTQLLEFSREELLGNPISKFIPDLRGLNKHAKRDSEKVMYHVYKATTRGKKEISVLANITRLEVNKEIMFMIGMANIPSENELRQDKKVKENNLN